MIRIYEDLYERINETIKQTGEDYGLRFIIEGEECGWDGIFIKIGEAVDEEEFEDPFEVI
ncbi:hypothetical protein ACWA2B_09950 [Paenibacillus sp. CMM36]